MTVVSYGRIGADDKSVEKTLSLAIRYAREDSQDEVVQGIADIIRRGHADDYDRIKAAFEFVVECVPYRHDTPDVIRELVPAYDEEIGAEVVTRPRFTLRRLMLGEDCDGQATALASILTALNIPNFLKVIAWKTDRESIAAGNPFTHVYNYVGLRKENKAFPVDVVMELDGFNNEKTPVVREKYYTVLE
jgi:hypothetical protein